MTFTLGNVKVDVGLCGSVPRSLHCRVPPLRLEPAGSMAPAQIQTLSENTSRKLNQLTSEHKSHSCLAACLPTHSSRSKSPLNRSKVGDSNFTITTAADAGTTVQPSPVAQKSHPGLAKSFSEETLLPEDIDMTRRSTATTVVEPPQWAVAARDDARLEPVCEAIGSHGVVDLTGRSFFRIGRSPASDVQLQHNTSSRRHAMVFHHPNGSCYVVDCGSSHGTFVNGVRVRNPSNGGMVIPHRIRRGSLIRFGGPGAPSFVLKSFAVGFSSMVKEFDVDDSIFRRVDRDSRQVFKVNNAKENSCSGVEGGILKKRSFEEVDESTGKLDAKRQRCVSPTLEQQEDQGPIRLVSPDSPRKSRRVTFYDHPEAICPMLVTSDELSSDEEDVVKS